MGNREYSFLSILSKPQTLIPPPPPQNWEELEGIKLNLMNFLLKLPKYRCIFSLLL